MTMTTTVSNDVLPDHSTTMPGPATRTFLDDARTIPAAIRSEWIKLSTVRSTKVMLWLNVAAGLLVSWALATFMPGDDLVVSEAAFFWTVVVAIVSAVGGVLLFTAEVQHGTLAAVLTAQSARWVVVVAKAAMAIGFGLAMGLASVAAGIAGTLLSGLEFGDASTLATSTLWGLAYTSLAAALGLGTGMIVRNSAVAVTGLMVWAFLLEGLLNLFLPVRVSRFFPFLAGDRLLQIDSTDMNPDAMAVALSRIEGALVFGGYAILALAIGTVLLYRRDVH